MLEASTLSFHSDIASNRLLEPHFLPPRLNGAVYRDFVGKKSFQSCCKMCSCILGFVYSSCMIRCSTTLSSCSSGILEHSVSRTMGRTRWTSSMACSLAWFKSLRFLSLGTSEAYCLCYRSQRRPGLATTNTEWIWDGPYDTWNFPASQEFAVQQCKVLRGSSRWTLRGFSLIARRS